MRACASLEFGRRRSLASFTARGEGHFERRVAGIEGQGLRQRDFTLVECPFCCFQTLWLIDAGLAHRLSLAEAVRKYLNRGVAQRVLEGAKHGSRDKGCASVTIFVYGNKGLRTLAIA